MLNSLLTPISQLITTNPDIFVIIWTVGMFIWLFIALKSKIGHKSTFTILGMLGTFIGLVAGLWMFDSTDMDQSIINLLEGLKVSFLTSIVGILCSLVFAWLSKKHNTENNLSLEEMLSEISKNTEKSSDNINRLVSALGGDSDNSLIGQIKLLKTDMNDNHKSLTRTMEKFAEEVSKASTEAIVEALQDVVKNFNEKITDQFGEHFKHLNEAVEKLVIWQSEYKEYMEQYKSNLEVANKSVQDNTERTKSLSIQLENIDKHTQKIPDNLKTLESIIIKQKEELVSLIDTLGAFAKIKEEAAKTIPEIEVHINKLIKSISADINEITKKLSDDFKQNSNDFSKVIQEAVKSSELQKQEITKNIDNMQRSIQSELTTSTKSIEDAMKNVFNTSDENIKRQVKEIIEQMGSELTSISKHLAKDYKELSLTLNESVSILKNGKIN